MRLATGLSRLCTVRGHYREGRQWLDWAATADPQAPAPPRAKALLGSGSLAFLQCDYPAAVRRLEAGLQLYRQIDDRTGVAAVLNVLGSIARERGRYARSEALYQESLQLVSADDDCPRMAQVHGYLGFTAWLQGHWEQAVTETEQSLAAFRDLGDEEGIVWALLSLGTVAQYQGANGRAAELLEQAHRMSGHLGYREGVAWSLHALGLLARRQQEARAEQLLLDALATHRELGDRWRTASVLEDLAGCAVDRGDDRRAVELLSAAAAIRTAIGTDVAPCEWADHERVETTARGRLAEQAFARAWAHGQNATLDELVARATEDAPLVEPAEPSRRPQRVRAVPPPTHLQPLRIRALGACTVHCGEQLLTTADWGYGKPRELLFLLASSPPLSKSRSAARYGPTWTTSNCETPFTPPCATCAGRSAIPAGWSTPPAGTPSTEAGSTGRTWRSSTKRSPLPGRPGRRVTRSPTCGAPSPRTPATSASTCQTPNGCRRAATSWAGRSAERSR